MHLITALLMRYAIYKIMLWVICLNLRQIALFYEHSRVKEVIN